MLDLAPLAFLNRLVQHVRFADLIDIALVTVLLYVLLTFLRQSMSRGTSRRALIVLLLFAVVYLASRYMGLYLVRAIIEALFIVFLLAAVVVFQADIRRMVDHVELWNLLGGSTDAPASEEPIDVLTEATARMAEKQTGALIAIKGDEPWDRQIEGGEELDGRMSTSLLCSLFNPLAPSHDGAVLVEGERITHFAAHLTLSSNLNEVGEHGTRHAAALGLSEHCDAFVIVVSEESGTISVAEEGRLTELASASDLKGRLEQFWKQHYLEEGAARLAWWQRRSLRRAFLSVVLATFLWLSFAYQPETVQRTFIVPIEMHNTPQELSLIDDMPTNVRVTLSGSEQAFRLLDPASLALSLNLERLEAGTNEFALAEDQLNLPEGVSLYRVEPSTVELQAQQMRMVEMDIEPQTTGMLSDSLALEALRPSPERITIHVPASGEPPEAIRTEPIDLGEITETADVESRLILPPNLRLPEDEDLQVSVRVEVRRRESGE